MVEESILTDDFLRELINVGEVDLLVGLDTFNDAKTVGNVMQAVRAGLLRYFPRLRTVVVNADGGSRDGTQELVRAASISDMRHVSNLSSLRTLHCISTQYSRESNGGGLHTILAAADLLRASSLVVISPESTNMEPEWVERLVRPVAKENYDLITPIYRRHKFDGLLVRTLLYPMTRAMYGKRLPGADSHRLRIFGPAGDAVLAQEPTPSDLGRMGAELQLSLSAMAAISGWGSRFVDQGADRTRSRRAGSSDAANGRGFVFVPGKFRGVEHGERVAAGSHHRCEHEVNLEPLRVNRKRLHQMFAPAWLNLIPCCVRFLPHYPG